MLKYQLTRHKKIDRQMSQILKIRWRVKDKSVTGLKRNSIRLLKSD